MSDSIVKQKILSTYFIPFICLLISAIWGSRAFVTGYLISLLFIYCCSYNFKLTRRFWQFTALVLSVSVAFLSFLVKADSSYGRLFIYKICGRIFKNYWVKGVGLDRFKVTYLYYQANYFKAGNYTSKELLLADNTYYAFNDYFQFILETGLIGAVIISLAFFIVIRLLRTAHKRSDSTLLILASSQLIAMMVAACFTYVFYRYAFQLALVGCLTIISFYAFRSRYIIINFLIFLTGGILIASVTGLRYQFNPNYYNALQEIPLIKEADRAGFKLEAWQGLQKVSGILKENNEYLNLYALQLANEGNTEKAIGILHKLLKKTVSNTLYLKIPEGVVEIEK